MTHGKICFFNSTKAWGGGEKWHFDIASRLHDKHGDVFVVAGNGSEFGNRLASTNVPHRLVSIGNLSFLNPVTLLRLISLFRKVRPDVLIMNLPADLKAAGIAARLSGVKRIIYRRGSAIPVRNSLLNRLLFRYLLDDIIANSEETSRTLLQENRNLFPEKRIHVIYNGVDWDRFDSLPHVPRLRPHDGPVVLGNVGRLVPQKGQETLIRLARRLKSKGYSFVIQIAGDGKLKDHLEQMAHEQGVAEQVRFLGFVETVPQFLQTIDIFLLPSHWEGFGYVLAEAMYCRKPVVAFDVSSNPEIVRNNETGFLVTYGDLDAFMEKVELLINDHNLRRDMGQAARQSVVERFSIQNTLTAVEQLLYNR
jgi:glycosyltransferase involved in cell wall biosynthesis